MPAGAVWSDTFNGAALDASKWWVDMWISPTDPMNRYATYSTDPRLYEVSNGTLKLRAMKVGSSWLQSMITTRGKMERQYGIWRASMKIPRGHALWPAFWLYDPAWSVNELDIVEAYPQPSNPVYTFCAHYGSSDCRQMALPNDYHEAFHVYEMEWRADVAIARIDGREVARHSIPSMPRMFTVLNQGVGVWWSNQGPTAETPLDSALEVDWVAVYP